MGDVFVARHRPVRTVVFVWVVMMVGACAAGSNDVTTPPDTGAPPNTDSIVTTTLPPSPTTTSTATTTPGPDEPGVVIAVPKASYRAEEVVEFIITNRLDVAITTRDQQGFCTVVNIDRHIGEVWTPAAPCISGPPPTDLVLAAGASMSIELPQSLEQGIYRGRLVYTIGEAFDVSATQEAVTDSFEVR